MQGCKRESICMILCYRVDQVQQVNVGLKLGVEIGYLYLRQNNEYTKERLYLICAFQI